MTLPVEPFEVRPTPIVGLWLLQTKQVTDDRGTIREFFRGSAFVEAGMPELPA